MSKVIAFFFLIFISLASVLGQSDYSLLGSLRVTNYSTIDYQANPQIFSIAQAPNGVMYFANQRGVLQYDGTVWTTLGLPDKGESLDLLIDEDVYVVSTSGLGKFVANETGVLVYEDMNYLLPKGVNDLHNIERFWDFYIVSNFDRVIVYDVKWNFIKEYVSSDKNIGEVSVLDDAVYFRGNNEEVIKYNEIGFSKLKGVPLENANEVVNVLDFKNKILIATKSGVVYELMGTDLIEVFSNDELTIKSAININDEYISLGTYVDGVVILGADFKPAYSVNTRKGLNDGTILCQYLDDERNLWLGTSNGISKVDLMSSIVTYGSIFDDATIEDVECFKNKVILATGGGAYEFMNDGELKKISGVNEDCFGLDQMAFGKDTSVFVSALYEVYKYDGKETDVVASGGPYCVQQSPLNENQLIVLHYDGIQLLEYVNGTFKEKSYIRNFSDGEPFNFIVTQKGEVWIGTKPNDGIYMTYLDDLESNEVSFTRFYEKEGLPVGQTYLFEHEGGVYAGTDFGIYKYVSGHFELYNGFGKDFSNGVQGVHRVNEDPLGNIWMVLFSDDDKSYEIGYSDKSEGYKWHSEFFKGYDDYIIHAVYHQDENVTWLGGPGGLMSFDKSRVSDHSVHFKAMIRQVSFGGEVLFGGNGLLKENYELAYNSKFKVEFNFASNSFFAEERTLYSWKLEGFDDDWREWTSSYVEDYALPEGNYTFKVKAMTVSGRVSEEASFSFTVLPPWYRTWWSYLMFALILVLIVWIIIRLSIRRIKLQNIRLEMIVEERTQEVVAQKAEAEKQRDIAEHQKHLIEEKNDEILDSINYAKRLQNAILTPVKNIYDTFENAFILYLPKDIVAGDFYWTNLAKLNQREGANLMAAADCTGHGVPGAMVSVVCSNALDRSVKEFGLKKPAEILDKTTDLVIETFEKSEDEVKDGMDISLCSFDPIEDKTKVQFAGANNNLWIVSLQKSLEVNGEHMEPNISNGDYHLYEIKATKQPVGKYLDRKPFENNEMILDKGDVVYMFTDGYADQFGGDKGKKFKYLPFKRLILDIQPLSLSDQLQKIHEEFNQWSKGYEQVDDVCVIGVRV